MRLPLRSAHCLIAMIAVGCSRSFTAAPTSLVADGGPEAPEVETLAPALGFAGQAVQIQGARFAAGTEAATLNQVRFGTTPATIDAAHSTSTTLVVLIPNLGPNATSVPVSIIADGLPAPTALAFKYRGPGHPVGFAASPAADLSPSPGPLAVTGGVQATTLLRRRVDALFEPTLGQDLAVAADVDYAPASATVFLGVDGGPDVAWFVEESSTNFLGGLDGVSVVRESSDVGGGNPNDGAFFLCGVPSATGVIPTAWGLVLLGDPSVDPQPNFSCLSPSPVPHLGIVVSPETDPLLSTAVALDSSGSSGWIAALTACDGGLQQCLTMRDLMPDAGVAVAFGPHALGPTDTGLPASGIALTPSGTTVYVSFGPSPNGGAVTATLGLPLDGGVPPPTSHPFAVSLPFEQLRRGLAASETRVASLVVAPPRIEIAGTDGSLAASVPLPGTPQSVTVDPVPPNHFFVGVASPPAVVEVDDSGVVLSSRPLSASLSAAAISPAGTSVAVSFDRLPGMAILDATTLSLPAPDYTYPNIAFGTPFQQAAVPGQLLEAELDQAVWIGDDVLCGLSYDEADARVVRCGVASDLSGSLFLPVSADGGDPACLLRDALPGERAVLRFDPPDGLVVYSGSQVVRYAVDATGETGASGQALVTCGAAVPSPPGTITPGWSSLTVSAGGEGGIELIPNAGLVIFFADGGGGPICGVNGTCTDLDQVQELVVDPLSQLLLVTYPNFTFLFTLQGGSSSIDLEGDQTLSLAFSPDASRFYLGTALGRVYEFDPSPAFAPVPDGGSSPFLSPLRTAVTGFPVRSIVADPTGSRLLLFGFDSDQLWLVE